ncbi:MATE family efflux transporter [Halegenticoccus soli]|uniref:MATE family efflux transporter n=1 Tax=Halegenticoccus soli TaxID=1985678 RepID=UPI000C6CE9C7|nr:MATE family efflux transporter [Halegenticoccus soli]
MRAKSHNPIRWALLTVGCVLARLRLINRRRVCHTTRLAWPRIVTGLARVSKSAVDIAMVGVAFGPAAIAGVGFASPLWGIAFAIGEGIADSAVGLVAARYGAERYDDLDAAVKMSALVAGVVTFPFAALVWVFPRPLLSIVTSDPQTIAYGATYLRILSFGIPFAILNLIASRTLVGAGDARSPMVLRAGGALVNIVITAALIFGLGFGVGGAAAGTVLASVAVTVAFAWGFITGELPYVGQFPITLTVTGPYLDRRLMRQLVEIGAPVALTNAARTGGQIPLLAIVGLFGPNVAAAFVVAQRVRALMDTPGWGFSLASSSLVGRALGAGAERTAEGYARDVFRFALVVYLLTALVVVALSPLIQPTPVDDPGALPFVDDFIHTACVSVVFYGVTGSASGPLLASGDTRWPLYGQALGLYVFALPAAYLGAVTPLGVAGICLALVAETLVPALVTYHRFNTGRWKAISRLYRPVD